MGDHTRVSWPLDFDPRIAAPSDEARSSRADDLEHLRIMSYKDDGATLDDLREAVTTLVETERTARRVLGGAHPLTPSIERSLRLARAALRARETPPAGDTE